MTVQKPEKISEVDTILNDKFIITQDKETAEKLLESGYIQIPSGFTGYKFLNNLNAQQHFADNSIDLSKIKYSNIFTT